MRAVDTNVLVRLIVRDDERQVHTAEAFIGGGAWVSHIALVGVAWVLESVYGRAPDAVAIAVEMLLHHEHLTLQDADAVTNALVHFRRQPKLGFSDCLMVELARHAGHGPLGTFDKLLGKVDGATSL
jgi:predicted nucleic-acid-binding protein